MADERFVKQNAMLEKVLVRQEMEITRTKNVFDLVSASLPGAEPTVRLGDDFSNIW